MSSMTREIGGKLPSKRQINLIVTEKPRGNMGRTLGIVLLAVIVVGAAGFYLFTGSQEVSTLQARLWSTEDELALLQKTSSEYDQVEEDHLRYSFAHLTDTEKNTQSGMMIIRKIEELVVPYGFVTEMSISGNTVSFTVYSEDIGVVTDSLLSDPLIKTVVPKSESKQESAETITVKENVSAMIMKTISGVQVIKRSDDPEEEETEEGAEDTGREEDEAAGEKTDKEENGGEKAGEKAEAETADSKEDEAASGKDKKADETIYLNTEDTLTEGSQDVQVTIVIPPVMSMAQLSVTFRDLEDN